MANGDAATNYKDLLAVCKNLEDHIKNQDIRIESLTTERDGYQKIVSDIAAIVEQRTMIANK